MDTSLWLPPKGVPHARQGLSPPASKLTGSISILQGLQESFFASPKEFAQCWGFKLWIGVLEVEAAW